jgi:hypothetical protein
MSSSANLHESNNTMPSTLVTTEAVAENGNNSNFGRDSPPTTNRVRFREGTDPLLHQSQTSMVIPEQPAGNSTPSSEDTPAPSSPTLSPILSSKTRHKATPSTRPSVFERLSKTETVASLHQKFLPGQSGTERKMKRSTSAPPSLRAKSSRRHQPPNNAQHINHSNTNNGNGKRAKNTMLKKQASDLAEKIVQIASSSHFFERLAETHTALSKSRRRPRSEVKTDTTRFKPKRSSSLGRRHTSDRWNSSPKHNKKTKGGRVRNRRAKEILSDTFDMESTGPPLEIEFSSIMKIMCSLKFVPEDGFEELDPFDLGLTSFLTEYEAGSLTAKDFASEIMSSLLWRDLPSSIKWDVRCPLERELAMPIGEIGYSFMIEASGKKRATDNDDSELDEDDDEEEELYTASATGNVTFLPDWEIQVENYSCVHDVVE